MVPKVFEPLKFDCKLMNKESWKSPCTNLKVILSISVILRSISVFYKSGPIYAQYQSKHNPAGTWRKNDVVLTSMHRRRYNVIFGTICPLGIRTGMKCLKLTVKTGWHWLYDNWWESDLFNLTTAVTSSFNHYPVDLDLLIKFYHPPGPVLILRYCTRWRIIIATVNCTLGLMTEQRRALDRSTSPGEVFTACTTVINIRPPIATMHGPHSLARCGNYARFGPFR